MAHKYWLVIVYHEVWTDGTSMCAQPDDDGCVDAYDTTVGQFTQQLAYVASQVKNNGLQVMTVRDALKSFAGQIPPTMGTVAITPSQPATNALLTATPTGFSAVDGSALTYHYQWYVGSAAIAGATSPTFDLSQAGHGDHGDNVSVQVYASDSHNMNSMTASATVTVLNSAPTAGTVTISPASPQVGMTLTATASGFTDIDNDALTQHYQWSINGIPVSGATGTTFALTSAGHGDIITVDTWATDPSGAKSPTATASVSLANAVPTKGTVTITPSAPIAGTALAATPSGFADADGDGLTYQYVWYRDGQPIAGATGPTLPAAEVVRSQIRVDVKADDGHGGVSDAASATVTVPNSPPAVGTVTISPTLPQAGMTLTATPSGFTDIDNDTLTQHYQWSINGSPVSGATGTTFVLTSAGHGDIITVDTWATDPSGANSPSATDNVSVDNAVPTKGTVTITPSAPVAGTALTATPSGFADADGDTLTYQYVWYRDGQPIAGATGPTLLAAEVVRSQIRVDVKADDGHHGVSDAASATVTVPNSPPAVGTVTISPTLPQAGMTLTATPSGFTDIDNDTLTQHYQWSVNGTSVSGATGTTFTLTSAGHGDIITVDTWATDPSGAKSPTATASVSLANAVPTKGTVTITPSSPTAGTALTATPSGFADADGDRLTYQYVWYHDGQLIAGATSPNLPAAAVLPGQIRVDARADDGHNGISDPASATVAVSAPPVTPALDTTPPSIAVASPLAKAYQLDNELPIKFSCTDTNSGVASCTATLNRISSKAKSVASGQDVQLAQTGRYVLRITAKDRSGNAATKAVTFTVVDKIAPRISVSGRLGKTYKLGDSVRVRFSIKDASGIAKSIATFGRVGERGLTVRSGQTMRLSSPGRYVLRITATDRHGNAAVKTLYLVVTR